MDAFEYLRLCEEQPDLSNGLYTVRGVMSGNCEGCGGCCGRVLPMSKDESARLLDFARRHGIVPHVDGNHMCAMLDLGTRKCMAYSARPLICRVWDSPTHAELCKRMPGMLCGFRADKIGLMAKLVKNMEMVDTWELFGVDAL